MVRKTVSKWNVVLPLYMMIEYRQPCNIWVCLNIGDWRPAILWGIVMITQWNGGDPFSAVPKRPEPRVQRTACCGLCTHWNTVGFPQENVLEGPTEPGGFIENVSNVGNSSCRCMHLFSNNSYHPDISPLLTHLRYLRRITAFLVRTHIFTYQYMYLYLHMQSYVYIYICISIYLPTYLPIYIYII